MVSYVFDYGFACVSRITCVRTRDYVYVWLIRDCCVYVWLICDCVFVQEDVTHVLSQQIVSAYSCIAELYMTDLWCVRVCVWMYVCINADVPRTHTCTHILSSIFACVHARDDGVSLMWCARDCILVCVVYHVLIASVVSVQ